MAKSYSPEDLAFRAFGISMSGIAIFIAIVAIFVL